MSSPPSESMEEILDRFDDAWNDPTPPCIEDYLTFGDAEQRLALLTELVRIDLERRLATGERVRVEETYSRQRFPELYEDASAVVTLVKYEYDMRRRDEPSLMPAEYLERFPQCHTDLLAQLLTLEDKCTGEQQQAKAEIPLAPSALIQLDMRGYEPIETLGKGGMGEVYRCCDPALGRDLAIKVIKAAHQGHPECEYRFLREARVTGSLQHPGIVPIHNLGRLSDGRLHYTMRLVRGRTLAEILKEEASKPERLPYLLTIFEKICQAAAYAHSKHIIHRDLKPHNIMVGRFGEVQVMDWGLAKVLAADAEPAVKPEGSRDAGGSRIPTDADTAVDLSRLGSGMGTLPYMPPEQALGEWDAVNERADVFALGSILCEMLTGQPAYSRADGEELHRRARRGDIAEALQRLRQRGADETLTALCRDCLNPCREDRPRDAAVVAKRLSEYQAEVQERLRQAEVERAEAQLKAREARKQRRLLIALVLALLAGGAVSTWQAVRATLAETKARENERQALAEGDDKKAVLAFFQDKVLSAGRPLGQPGGQGSDVSLGKAIEKAESEIAASFEDRPLVEASIRNTLGSTYWYLGEAALAIRQHERALALFEEKLGPDHSDTLSSRNNLAVAYSAAGRTADAIRLHEQTLQLREAKLGPDHPDTLESRNNLGVEYGMVGRTDDAIVLLEPTLKQMETHLGPDHPRTLVCRNNLASVYRTTGRTAEAIDLYQQTLKQMEGKLGPDQPDTLICRYNLASAYTVAGRVSEAIPLLEITVERCRKRPGGFPAQLDCVPDALAEIYNQAEQFAKAEVLLRDVLEQLLRQFGPEDPHTARLMVGLGANLLYQHKYADAEPLLRACLKVREAKLSDDWVTFNTQSMLGHALLGQKKHAASEPLLLQGYQGLKARQAKVPPVRLTEALERLLQLYDALGNKDEAAKWRKLLDERNVTAKKPPP